MRDYELAFIIEPNIDSDGVTEDPKDLLLHS